MQYRTGRLCASRARDQVHQHQQQRKFCASKITFTRTRRNAIRALHKCTCVSTHRRRPPTVRVVVAVARKNFFYFAPCTISACVRVCLECVEFKLLAHPTARQGFGILLHRNIPAQYYARPTMVTARKRKSVRVGSTDAHGILSFSLSISLPRSVLHCLGPCLLRGANPSTSTIQPFPSPTRGGLDALYRRWEKSFNKANIGSLSFSSTVDDDSNV